MLLLGMGSNSQVCVSPRVCLCVRYILDALPEEALT